MSGAAETLQQIFRNLSPQELEAMAAVTVIRDYPAGSVVCYEGKLEHVFYIIQEGQVEITHRLPDGSEQALGVKVLAPFLARLHCLRINRGRLRCVP